MHKLVSACTILMIMETWRQSRSTETLCGKTFVAQESSKIIVALRKVAPGNDSQDKLAG